MPTGYMLAVAKVLEDAARMRLYDLTNVSINLYKFQYNGLDKSGFGGYPHIDLVVDDIERLVEAVFSYLRQLES
ncbi:hypothetical protein [Pyrobaculum islandicum]|nr:hypothetical protein [Pyrobaculum islandicum]